GALVRLANNRAQQVKDWLADNGHIPAARLFIVSPKVEGAASPAAAAPASGAAEAAAPAAAEPATPAANGASKSAAPGTRVDLKLK
ncbi:MAG: hypothetical protein IT508_06715, partial [Burkholderiaceae bacterium]|nr:hypothetical protein [Burkholderiaceae bacterium]